MLLWLDLETTGLDPVHNRVLEVGWTITDGQLQSRPAWLRSMGDPLVRSELVTPSLETWDQLEEFNAHFDMHIKSGLYDDLHTGEQLMLSDIEDMILKDISEAEQTENEQVILAGSGVHFDKAFINIWMFRLAVRLHYRIFDMSTIKRFVALVGLDDTVSTETHRAGQDVAEALILARQWRGLIRTALDEQYGDVTV